MNEFNIYHVYPNDDKHEASEKCWCNPVMEYKDVLTLNEVWVHNENIQ